MNCPIHGQQDGSSDAQVKQLLAHQEVHAAMEMPAPRINRMVMEADAEVMRLAFLERRDDMSSSIPRAAVSMSYDDASALLGVLTRTLQIMREKRQEPGDNRVVFKPETDGRGH